jgi:hypothetical protein
VRVDGLVGLLADLHSESLILVTVVASWDCKVKVRVANGIEEATGGCGAAGSSAHWEGAIAARRLRSKSVWRYCVRQ